MNVLSVRMRDILMAAWIFSPNLVHRVKKRTAIQAPMNEFVKETPARVTIDFIDSGRERTEAIVLLRKYIGIPEVILPASYQVYALPSTIVLFGGLS